MNPDQQQFVREVLRLYLDLPDTPHRFSRYDRAIAQTWFDQQIPLPVIHQAMILAQVRRAARNPDQPNLGPIRSLHYFAPVISEVQSDPFPPKYFEYLQRKLRQLTDGSK
jgi:hypothetical protein